MGQAQSDAFQDAVADVTVAPPASASKPTLRQIKLFQFVSAGNGGNWTLVTGNATPRFYNANEDSGKKAPNWFLEIDGSDVDVRVDNDLGYMADLRELRFTFGAAGTIWALRFGNEEAYKVFIQDLNDKAFTNLTGAENDAAGRAEALGEDYAGMFFNTQDTAAQAQEPMDVDGDDPPPVTPTSLRERNTKHAKEGDEDTIHALVIGARDNNYLVRGKHFDVLRNVPGGVEDQHLSFQLTPPRPAPSGRGAGAGPSTPGLTPSRVLLAHGEREMIMLTPDNQHVLQQADIEAGKIVSTWKFQKDSVDIPIRDITHDNKTAQLEERSTFMGLDANRLTRWDMRDPHGAVAQSPVLSYTGGKDYARGTNFTCMATSGDGYVAVGATDGKIRLYSSKNLTRANTCIPGLGSPITSIDVTYDGKWVLATTDKYLMLVKTTFNDDKTGKANNGFTGRMGGRGSVPRLLRLKPEDTARTGGKPLHKGKFTWITESGKQERWVVAQCGRFSVVWNFARIRTSGADGVSVGGLPACTDYLISAKDGDVVDAAFLHPKFAKPGGLDASLVVATPTNVTCLGG